MATNENKLHTREEASANLRELLVARCPESAVEIFQAVTDLVTATMREVHTNVLNALEKQP